jgi:hypothetical protein
MVKKNMKQKKKFDLFDETMDVGMVGAGAVTMSGFVGKIGGQIHSPSAGRIIGGMGIMSMLPTVRATQSVFRSMSGLEQFYKKKKW